MAAIHYEVMVKTRDGWRSYVCIPTKAEAINWEQYCRAAGYKEVKTYLRRP